MTPEEQILFDRLQLLFHFSPETQLIVAQHRILDLEKENAAEFPLKYARTCNYLNPFQ